MNFKWICVGIVVILTLAVGVKAEEEGEIVTDSAVIEEMRDYYGDEEFVTIATGSKKPVFKAPAVATVITSDEIKAIGARNLDEVVEIVAGLHVVPSTQGRLDSIYSVRGIHTKFNPQVLVLINGIPFPHFSGGKPFQFHLPLAGISRVEVIRGPGSAIYGADAYAGIINIITKEAEDIRGTEMGARIGSFDTHDLWVQHGKNWGGWDVAFSLEWQESEGDRERRISSDFQTFLDSMPELDTDVSLAPGPLETRYEVFNTHLNINRGNWRFRHWFWNQEDAGLGAGSSLALDPAGGEDLKQHLVDLTYQSVGFVEDWDFSANVNYLYRSSKSRFVALPPGTRVPIGVDGNLDLNNPRGIVLFPDGLLGNPSGKEDATGLDLVALYSGLSNHRWRIGSGIKKQRFFISKETKNFGRGVLDGSETIVDRTLSDVTDTKFAFLPDSSRTIWYLSLQDEWQFARDWELTAGIRYDHYSDFGSTVNPRLALVWATRHNLTSKVLYGRAFRAPSFSEQFSANNPVGLGNPNLDPETIDTLEIAFDYRPTFDLQTNLAFFAYRAEDLIEFVPSTNVMETAEVSVAQNARSQDGYGFELELDWRMKDDLRFRGNYAWQRSEDASSGQRIADAPGQQLYVNATWEFLSRWTFSPQFHWIGSRKRARADIRSKVDDYSLVHMTLRREKIFGHWDASFTVRNLFDEDVLEPSTPTIPSDYPLEGRSFCGEVSYRF